MSTKHLRRLLQEKEAQDNEQNDDKSDDEEPKTKGNTNRFQFLEDEDLGEDDEEVQGTFAPSQSKQKQKEKKNKKKKAKNAKNKDEEKEDDDTLLERLAAEARIMTVNASEEGELGETAGVEELFKVDPRQLDPTEELKRVLGKLLRESSSSTRETAHFVHKAGWGRIAKAKTNWPAPKAIGLSMEPDVERQFPIGLKWFRFSHNGNYEKCERLCWVAEDTLNHELVNEVLSSAFYHLNGLLMYANVFRMQDDITQCCDCIERGIFFAEQAFHPLFQVFSWQHRLDYAVYENRAFFLLLHRHMLNCVHKRCFKTALNIGKLLFGLEPQGDPLGVLLVLDSIALRAKQYSWLRQTFAAINEWKKLELLPNWLYSLALAAYLEKQSDADILLEQAIIAHPSVVTEILNELQMQPDSEVENNAYLKGTAFAKEPEGLQLLIKIYVKQTAELWKAPNVIGWLENITRQTIRRETLAKKMEEWKVRRFRSFVGVPLNLRRAAFLVGVDHSATSITDPLPPANGRARYTKSLLPPQHVDGFLSGFLHSIYPDYQPGEHLMDAVRRMIQDFVGGNGTEERDPNAQPPQPQ
ncbi:unnamed protein product, partial [Mesorhabditis belari]|uniref:Transcription factor 25 n=1 Tax=Mesorhabditis belari TaxID=2138241 RepID=A0AAF3F650_9BILA